MNDGLNNHLASLKHSKVPFSKKISQARPNKQCNDIEMDLLHCLSYGSVAEKERAGYLWPEMANSV